MGQPSMHKLLDPLRCRYTRRGNAAVYRRICPRRTSRRPGIAVGITAAGITAAGMVTAGMAAGIMAAGGAMAGMAAGIMAAGAMAGMAAAGDMAAPADGFTAPMAGTGLGTAGECSP
jgi:hypothetical protein